ncbi:N-acetylglucosamine-6-phosphate deacetylase [Staphylococcus saccharolyticus]|uniref:N-acetylglucosamine-6-phosphate deacetylase n=1 Tax=Staphylococcus saccharolyticus TaxID=33028 RepID=UPI0032DFD300
MSEYVISNGKVYTEGGTIENGFVHIKDDKIVDIGERALQNHTVTKREIKLVDACGQHILPGFIDIHIHGGYGEDAMDASSEGLQHLAESLLSEGTTSFLATTMTQSTDNIERALKTIATYQQQQDETRAAEIVGVHLEGPFISEHKVGAQHPKYVQRPSVNKINKFQKIANGLIKIMTFAPEVEGAKETLMAMKDDIIFSIGHTVATFEQANEAISNGAKHITHLYNAATGFQHREPGVFGAAWINNGLNTEMIVDGVHSHPASVAIAYRLKGNQHCYLITDAMRAKGMPDGHYDLGGQDVIVKGKEARLTNGALAGSILKMNEGLHNLMEFTGDSLDHLWRVTSLNQAIAIGIDDVKGSIKIGKDADIAILDDERRVTTTIKKGKIHHF